MKLVVKDLKGQDQGEVEVQFALVEGSKGNQAVHDAVVAYQANQRMGTACTKTMGEVAGSGKKPWRQKGTGRARTSSLRSPIFPGGGVVFGPKPRDFGKKVTKKTRRLAFRKAVSERLKAGDVFVVSDLELAQPKTRIFSDMLDNMGFDGTVLVVINGDEKNVRLAARNIPTVQITSIDALSTYEVLRQDKLLFSRSSFEKLEARLQD